MKWSRLAVMLKTHGSQLSTPVFQDAFKIWPFEMWQTDMFDALVWRSCAALQMKSRTCHTSIFYFPHTPKTKIFMAIRNHSWGCCTADGCCKTYFPASAPSTALKMPCNIDRWVDVFTDLADWSHNESALTCCSWFQVLNVGHRQIIWRDIN